MTVTTTWDVPRETSERLKLLCSLVREWTATVQLVSRGDLDRLEERHVGNSLAILPILRAFAGHRMVDLGSGAGFPGLVIAIVLGGPIHLIEADRRKAAFLLTAASRLGCDVLVHACRAKQMTERFDVLVARAVGPLSVLVPMARSLLVAGGTGLFLKGDAAVAELNAAKVSGLVWIAGQTAVVEVRT